MNEDLPIYEPEPDATYQLDVIAGLTGISSETILHYQENGLIHPREDTREFDEEVIRKLRQIEHLRSTLEIDLSGLKLILDLMDQVERLQKELRASR